MNAPYRGGNETIRLDCNLHRVAAVLDPAPSDCRACAERLFATELQVFLGRCQALVGAITFGSEPDALEVLESTMSAMPRARTPAHHRLLRSLLRDFVEACARGVPEHDRLRSMHWDDSESLAVTFRGACEAALFERVWAGRVLSPLVHRALSDVRRYATDSEFDSMHAARTCGVSTPYLLRRFRAEVGLSFSAVVRRQRVNFARRRLLTSSDSVKEVGASVGYDSCTRFVREFRRECGVTPGQFRLDGQTHHS